MGRVNLLGSRSKKQAKAPLVWKVKETRITLGKMGARNTFIALQAEKNVLFLRKKAKKETTTVADPC